MSKLKENARAVKEYFVDDTVEDLNRFKRKYIDETVEMINDIFRRLDVNDGGEES